MEVARSLGVKCHVRGTMLSVEGPRFSSRAESLMFRQWGADVINMTTVPEVVLAKEAGLCYASIAMATDYDCWKEHEEAVSGSRWRSSQPFFITLMSLLSLFVPCVSQCQQSGIRSGWHHFLPIVLLCAAVTYFSYLLLVVFSHWLFFIAFSLQSVVNWWWQFPTIQQPC